MWLVYLVVAVLVGSFAAIIVAVIVIVRNNRRHNSLETVTIRGEVVGSGASLPEGHTLFDPNHLGASRTNVLFVTDKDQYIRLNVSDKEYYRLIQGMYGDITYQGNQLIAFTHLPEHEEARRQQQIADAPYLEGDASSDIYLFVNMPSINIVIPSDQAIKANQQQIMDIVQNIYDNTTDNFVGLDNEQQVIQFMNDGSSQDIVLDIPNPTKKGSYQAILHDIESVQDVIESYWNNEEIITQYHATFKKW